MSVDMNFASLGEYVVDGPITCKRQDKPRKSGYASFLVLINNQFWFWITQKYPFIEHVKPIYVHQVLL